MKRSTGHFQRLQHMGLLGETCTAPSEIAPKAWFSNHKVRTPAPPASSSCGQLGHAWPHCSGSVPFSLSGRQQQGCAELAAVSSSGLNRGQSWRQHLPCLNTQESNVCCPFLQHVQNYQGFKEMHTVLHLRTNPELPSWGRWAGSTAYCQDRLTFPITRPYFQLLITVIFWPVTCHFPFWASASGWIFFWKLQPKQYSYSQGQGQGTMHCFVMVKEKKNWHPLL